MRLRALAGLVTALAATAGLGLQAPATAVTGGTPDVVSHPEVAAIFAYTPEGRALCTATLISPTVLLTAGHCTDGVTGRVLVDFDPVVTDAPPLPFTAADPEQGFTTAEVTASGHQAGTAHTYPGFEQFADAKNPNDVGVVVLDEPAPVAPAHLAEVGTLDAIPASQLSRTEFTVVGYGAEVRKAGSGGPSPQYYPLIRRSGVLNGQKVSAQILQTNSGGAVAVSCFGDSGGPVFRDGEIVAVVSTGSSSAGKCDGVARHQRVDLAAVQGWLAQFVS